MSFHPRSKQLFHWIFFSFRLPLLLSDYPYECYSYRPTGTKSKPLFIIGNKSFAEVHTHKNRRNDHHVTRLRPLLSRITDVCAISSVSCMHTGTHSLPPTFNSLSLPLCKFQLTWATTLFSLATPFLLEESNWKQKERRAGSSNQYVRPYGFPFCLIW